MNDDIHERWKQGNGTQVTIREDQVPKNEINRGLITEREI